MLIRPSGRPRRMERLLNLGSPANFRLLSALSTAVWNPRKAMVVAECKVNRCPSILRWRCTGHKWYWMPVSTSSHAHWQTYCRTGGHATYAEMEIKTKVLDTLRGIMAEQVFLTLLSPLETTIPTLLFLWITGIQNKNKKKNFKIHASQLSPIQE